MKYVRTGLPVDAVQYTLNSGIEDGFELWSKIVVNGWIKTDRLIQVTRNDGTVVCPYIDTRRGRSFIKQGDYVITEEAGDRIVCGEDKFSTRYRKV
ncbi:hypothetical protein [Anaerosporobacter faecicola]|uniref:hypothetical protein n=1 Tax=Anaerosporobacter faecicola TaxID=2718714 RepID=UPI0014391B37|nr:hypothetical protein [Anaerosporobacter faecicola]